MYAIPLLPIATAIVPSWFEKIVTSEKICLTDLGSYPELYNSVDKDKIDKEDLYGYVLVNNQINKVLGEPFSDLTKVAEKSDNIAFNQTHSAAIDVYHRLLTDEKFADEISGSNNGEDSSIFKPGFDILAKEHYYPKMVDGELFLLIGAKEPVFKDKRAFWNAVIETLRGTFTYEQLKRTLVWREYLRHAVSSRR